MDELQKVIEQLKARKFRVYGPSPLTTYAWFTDGKRIGYVQYSRHEGITWSTVHKSNRQCGTGFRASNADRALEVAPHWATASDTEEAMRRKFTDFAEFAHQHWQPLTEY